MPLIFCPDCGKQISDAAPACIHCGRPMAVAAPRPRPDEQITPGSRPRDPGMMGFLSLLLPGLGQVVAGQAVKGFAVMGGSGVIAFLTGFAAMLFIWPAAVIDAYLVARKLDRGEPVDRWEWFPR